MNLERHYYRLIRRTRMLVTTKFKKTTVFIINVDNYEHKGIEFMKLSFLIEEVSFVGR
jgi:hypothetical protein